MIRRITQRMQSAGKHPDRVEIHRRKSSEREIRRWEYEKEMDQTLLLNRVLSEFADSQFGVCESKPVNIYKGHWANEPEMRWEHELERHCLLKWKHSFSSRSWMNFFWVYYVAESRCPQNESERISDGELARG